MRNRWAVLTAAMLLALAGCDSAVNPTEEVVKSEDLVDRDVPPLTAVETRVFLRDSTLRHEGDRRVWHVYVAPDGRLVGHSRDKETGGVERALGTWQVMDDGRICRQWSGDWAGGDTGCAKVYRYGDDYVFVGTEGDETGTEIRRTRLPGNPIGL